MQTVVNLEQGAVFKAKDLVWKESGNCLISHPVHAKRGAKRITGVVVRIPAGEIWTCCETVKQQEVIAVVFRGQGHARVGTELQRVAHASALYAPTGIDYSVYADQGEEMTLYIWQSELGEGRHNGTQPRLFNHLYNDETVFQGYAGNALGERNERPASMNFLFWPGTGSGQLCLHCGIQQPGQSFSIHQHPMSEELFIGIEGEGQVHLNGQWYDFAEGDILYAPEGMYHGTRNPHTGPNASRFVTCGGPVPFDASFYALAGLSAEVN